MSCTSSGMMTSLKFRRSSGSGKSIWHVFGRFRSARSKEHDFLVGHLTIKRKHGAWWLAFLYSQVGGAGLLRTLSSAPILGLLLQREEFYHPLLYAGRCGFCDLRPLTSEPGGCIAYRCRATWHLLLGLGGRWYIGEMRWVPGAFQGVWLGYPSLHEAVSVGRSWSTQMLRRLVGYIEQRRLLHFMRHSRIVFKNFVFNAKKDPPSSNYIYMWQTEIAVHYSGKQLNLVWCLSLYITWWCYHMCINYIVCSFW